MPISGATRCASVGLRTSRAFRLPQVVGSSQQCRNLSDQVALKKQPKGKKKKPPADTQEEISKDSKSYKMVLAALNAPVTKPPPASADEMERRYQVGRNYVIGSFEEHNELEHMLSCKIRMKNHAIKMLPRNSENSIIRKAALEIDDEGPPVWRHIPVWTPPIKDFNPDDYLEEEDDD